MANTPKKTVLITGCSTGGIGWAMAKQFHQRGFHVFATARDPSKMDDGDLVANKVADDNNNNNVEVLALDVTVPESIARCREVVAQRTAGRGLDVLVNNAGVEFNSPLLDTDLTEARRLYDINVWGLLAMVQAFAPLLVEAKGVVFNQSSIDAVLNMVWAGIFSSSKAAVARLSETLRVELEPLGVRVITSMCGSADTPMFTKPGGSGGPMMALPASSYYRGQHVETAAWEERMEHQRQATPVDVLAAKLVRDIVAVGGGDNSNNNRKNTSSRRKGRVVWNGAFASLVRWASWLNVIWLVDGLINSSRGLKQVKRL